MGVMEVIKKSFGIANKNIKLLIVLFVFNIIGLFLRGPQAEMTPGTPPPPPSPPVIILSLLLALVGILVFCGLIGYLKEYIKTQKESLNTFVEYGKKFYFRIIGVWLLVAAITMGFAIIAAVGISLSVTTANPVGIAIALAIGLIAGGIGAYVFLLFLMSPYILITDDTKPMAAIKGSIAFVRAHLLKVLGLLVLLILISIGIGLLSGILGGLLTLIIKGVAGKILLAIIGSAFNSYVNILFPASFLLFYLSRKEAEKPSA